MNKSILVALSLLIAMAAIGYASISASKYNDVSSLAGQSSPVRVTVSGSVVDMGTGGLVMVYNGGVYRVESRGVYAIAENPETGESYALFLLKGDNGFMVAALYPARDFVTKYGGSPVVEAQIVVDGVYRPDKTVSIGIMGSQGFTPLYEVPVLEVDAILKGCHSSYQQQQAVVQG